MSIRVLADLLLCSLYLVAWRKVQKRCSVKRAWRGLARGCAAGALGT